ncbi:protein rolling stone-like [Acanthaster planci]|uniref:Protein rolling stone-like n=1 Tax=Acanthaster planci TaxID=133434 RepID=A0A8B7ZPL7_ACAPL|nr:protein rolling stone-like [Acanthaster planci]
MACGGRLKLSDFWLNHGDATLFARPQWPIHQFVYLAWRVFLALYLLGWLICRLAIGKDIGPFFVFLTDWTFTVLTLYSVSTCVSATYFTFANGRNRFYVTRAVSHFGRTGQELGSHVTSQTSGHELPPLPPSARPLEGTVRPRLPHYFKLVWLLFNICLTVDPIVTIVYWSLLASPGKSGLGLAMDVHFHALNTVFIYADLLLSAIPVGVVHFIYPFLYGILYISFTLIYFWAGGMNPDSGGTAIYPRVLDWSRPGWTILSCVLISLAVPLIHLIGYGGYRLRVFIHERFFSHQREENCILTGNEETPEVQLP